MAHGPLHGIRVLEFSQIVAGPYTGLNLADLGADVIKVEPPEGDSLRSLGAVVPGESKGFQSLNRGKRGLMLNLADQRARAVIHRLVAHTDVVTINYRFGVAEQLQIDYDTLRALQPDLIYVQITGFGSRGPYASRAGSDLAIQGYSGLMAGEGKVDETGAPMAISCTALADYATGLATAMAICAALFHRQRTGEGQRIETSLLATALALQGAAVMREPVTDAILRDPMLAEIDRLREEGASYAQVIGRRGGNRSIVSSFRLYYSAYRAKDGGLVLGALTKANRNAMRTVLGVTDENSDEDGYNALDPVNIARAAQWRQEIQRILLTRTVAEWLTAFEAGGAPVSAVNLPEEMSEDRQVDALGLMVDLEHEVTGPQRQVGPIVEMSATPARACAPSPPLGRHTWEILAEAGFSPDELTDLRAEGVLV